MAIFNKTFWKFAALFAMIILLGWGIVQIIQYYQYRKSPEYQAEQYLKEMEQKYREDTYGGSTPEETIQLFINALKNGDTDFASKYFVVDKQEEWKNYLQNKNINIENLIDEAQKLKLTKKDNNKAFFIITNKEKIVEVQVILVRNINNKWKISEL